MTTDDEHDQDPGTAPRAPGPGSGSGLGQVFTQAEAARVCGVGRTTIRRWRQSGLLPGAYETPEGTWMLDLLAHGTQVGTPAPPDPGPGPRG